MLGHQTKVESSSPISPCITWLWWLTKTKSPLRLLMKTSKDSEGTLLSTCYETPWRKVNPARSRATHQWVNTTPLLSVKATICGRRADRGKERTVMMALPQHDAFRQSANTLTTACNSELDRTHLKWLLLVTMTDTMWQEFNNNKTIRVFWGFGWLVYAVSVTCVDTEVKGTHVCFFVSCDGRVVPVKSQTVPEK